MPYGLLIGVLVQGAVVVLTLVSPRKPPLLGDLSFRLASVYNEAPFLFIYVILISSLPSLLDRPLTEGWSLLAWVLMILVVSGLLLIAWQATTTRPVVQDALDESLGSGWRDQLAPEVRSRLRKRAPLANILLIPFVFKPSSVERIRNISYGDAGRRNLMDLYRPKTGVSHAPVLLYFHAGGFRGGRKSVEGRAPLFRLASQGWVTISANYRLLPQFRYFDHLLDVKKVIRWVRENGAEHGADPATIFLSGGSAGGNLSSMAALTQNNPKYQPGFEEVDTSVSGVASLYGWYGGYWGMGGPYSEMGLLGHDTDDAPPFFIAHGEKDSLALVETARRFVDHLRDGSSNPVVYAQLPNGQHAFDLFHSIRFSAVVDGIEAFVEWVRARQ